MLIRCLLSKERQFTVLNIYGFIDNVLLIMLVIGMLAIDLIVTVSSTCFFVTRLQDIPIAFSAAPVIQASCNIRSLTEQQYRQIIFFYFHAGGGGGVLVDKKQSRNDMFFI